jgi:hypothetical protein
MAPPYAALCARSGADLAAVGTHAVIIAPRHWVFKDAASSIPGHSSLTEGTALARRFAL